MGQYRTLGPHPFDPVQHPVKMGMGWVLVVLQAADNPGFHAFKGHETRLIKLYQVGWIGNIPKTEARGDRKPMILAKWQNIDAVTIKQLAPGVFAGIKARLVEGNAIVKSSWTIKYIIKFTLILICQNNT